jgi:hypothetical protein
MFFLLCNKWHFLSATQGSYLSETEYVYVVILRSVESYCEILISVEIP